MNIRERNFKEFGVPVPEGRYFHAGRSGRRPGSWRRYKVAKRTMPAAAAAGALIQKSRRGEPHAESLLVLVTHQTGPDGKEVKRLLIEEGCKIEKEYYIGLVLDRSISRVVLMASEEGGTDIEEVAAKTPEKIFKEIIDPAVGLLPFQARRLAFNINIPKHLLNQVADFMLKLYQVYIEKDCTIAEINPLVCTSDGKLLALDAKLNFDENALYRNEDILQYRDLDEEDPKELEASKHGLSYVSLDGNIGCMVNGADCDGDDGHH